MENRYCTMKEFLSSPHKNSGGLSPSFGGVVFMLLSSQTTINNATEKRNYGSRLASMAVPEAEPEEGQSFRSSTLELMISFLCNGISAEVQDAAE